MNMNNFCIIGDVILKRNEMTKNDKVLENFIINSKNSVNVSVNERSLQLFGDEKFLASSEGKKLLNKHKLTYFHLKCYETPEPFLYYINNNSINNNVLIVENKDTWFTMKKILMENKTILGENFKYLIYGQGRKIQKSFFYIEELESKCIFNVNKIYYFGDIDSSGIDIFYKLKNKYQKYFIRPFSLGYEFLIKNKDKKRIKNTNTIKLSYYKLNDFRFLNKNDLFYIYDICNANYIIPQEILNYEELDKYNKKTEI